MRMIKTFLGAATALALVAGPALAEDEGFDASLCVNEPVDMEGWTAEDFAAWLQIMGASMGMHVKVFESVDDPSLKFIAAADPFYGLVVNMYKDETACTIDPETVKSYETIEVPIAPGPDPRI